jgi:hypothetical protein
MPAFLFEGCLKIRQIGDLTAASLSAGWWGLHRVGSHFPPLANLSILQWTAGREPGSCRSRGAKPLGMTPAQ